MFTGSLAENRCNIGIPALIRQALYDDARAIGMKTPEFIRTILLRWYEDRQRKDAR